MSQLQPPAPPRLRGGRANSRRSLWVGVAAAIVADVVIIILLPGAALAPTLRRGPPSTPPSAPAGGPTVAITPRPSATKGELALTPDLQRGLVLIRAINPASMGQGTGMVLTPEGRVLTNYHVVRSSSRISVTVATTSTTYPATLVGRDAQRDVALLQLTGARGLETVNPDRDPVAVGDTAIVAGNAGGQGYITAFQGQVTDTSRTIRVKGPTEFDPDEELRGVIETDAHAEPGDSGGAMFDAENEVLGMTTAGTSPTAADQTSYAVPIGHALGVVDKIQAGDESGTVVIGPKPFLGIVADRTPASDGVTVTRVDNGSAADKAGLRVGDTITALDGVKVSTHHELATALDALEPGQTVPLTWRTRGGSVQVADVTLGTSELN